MTFYCQGRLFLVPPLGVPDLLTDRFRVRSRARPMNWTGLWTFGNASSPVNREAGAKFQCPSVPVRVKPDLFEGRLGRRTQPLGVQLKHFVILEVPTGIL